MFLSGRRILVLDTSQTSEKLQKLLEKLSRDLIFRGSDLLLRELEPSVPLRNFILNYFLIITNSMADNRIMILWSLRCCECKTPLALSEAHRIFLAHMKAEFRCRYGKRKVRKKINQNT